MSPCWYQCFRLCERPPTVSKISIVRVSGPKRYVAGHSSHCRCSKNVRWMMNDTAQYSTAPMSISPSFLQYSIKSTPTSNTAHHPSFWVKEFTSSRERDTCLAEIAIIFADACWGCWGCWTLQTSLACCLSPDRLTLEPAGQSLNVACCLLVAAAAFTA